MKQKVNEILNDLYAIDDGFKAHERELRSLVEGILRSEPDTHFDEKFASRLRADLLGESQPVVSPYSAYSAFFARFQYGAIGAFLMLLIVAPITYKLSSRPNPNFMDSTSVKNISSGLTLKQQISKKGMNAFGPLAVAPAESEADSAAGKGGSSAAVSSLSAPSSSMSISASRGIAAPAQLSQETLRFSFASSTSVKLDEATSTVYKRTKGINSGKQLGAVVQNFDVGLAKLSTFSDVTVRDVELSEDHPFGYMVSLNFVEGMVSINKNAETWPAEAKSVAASELADDQTYIAIANEFLQTHGVDVSGYGKPTVQKTSPVVVTYPTLVGSMPVYDESGYQYGVQVIVDAGEKKVASVNNLMSQTYESSQYGLETDPKNILNAINTHYQPKGAAEQPVKDVKLGTAQKILMRYWVTKDSAASELYVPALLFPVIGADHDPTLPSYIIAPIVKTFLAEKAGPNIYGGPAAVVEPIIKPK